jgi:hypothetical protein
MAKWIVELEPGVYLASLSGDPGRTLQVQHACVYDSHPRARTALLAAQKLRPFERARVTLAPEPERPKTADHIAALEAALQAGPTDGPWYASGHFGEWAIASDHSVEGKLHAGAGRQFVACCFRASKKDAPKYARMFEATARYIAAANPAAIRAVLAEVKRLREDLAGEQARADMHADLGRRTAEALGLKPEEGRSHMPEVAAKLLERNCELARWKSINAPRLEAKTGLLESAQLEAAAGQEAIATLASEREANAILTQENERLRAENEALKISDRRYQALRNSGHMPPEQFDQEVDAAQAAKERTS